MNVRQFLIAVLLLGACTSTADDGGRPVRGPTIDENGEPVVPIAVVTAASDEMDRISRTYLDGVRLAIREVNRAGGIGGTPLRLEFFDDASFPLVLERSIATLVVGAGKTVVRARASIEGDGDPVFVLGDDLYSQQHLFRQVFQVTPPLSWQAEPLARYLVHDRGYEAFGFITRPRPPEFDLTPIIEAALVEEGSHLEWSPLLTPQQVRSADALIMVEPFVSPSLGTTDDAPLLAFTANGLVAREPAPRTVAAYPYTWAAWADPIPRVRAFRERFERVLGHAPTGFEQEGYDAVRLLADGLERTEGRGGPELVGALESTRDATYSALPITLGPDDHIVAGRGQIGIFVRLADGEIDDRTSPTGIPWAPLMRTFTYNGLRTSIIDDDKRVFFPAWRQKAPAPAYPRSRFGITTGPDDLAH